MADRQLGDARWYEAAVFYELLPRSFFDSNADGIGDFSGLTARLDYLEWLGVDCLWLLPFYPSPLRDGGYDVSDFMSVAPECGSVDDLAALVELSSFHFCRAFRDSFGDSPHAYVTRRRIERAQGLMLTTDNSLSQVAMDCGLADQAHFNRLFRRFVGESPGAWRRARVIMVHSADAPKQAHAARLS